MGREFFLGRRAVITGGSSGIGAAVAGELVRRGAHVFLLARHKDRLDQTVAALKAVAKDPNQKIDAAVADVSVATQVAEAVTSAEQRIGPIDLLINSAGITQPGYAEDLPIEAYRAQMDTNYMGTVHTVKAALPLLISRRAGWIVNLSSAAGLKGIFGYAGYCASKFAVVGFSEALRAELVRHGIGVTVVCPPDTRTPMLAAESPLRPPETAYLAAQGKVLEPEEVALAILAGVERRKALVVPGFDGKLLRFANGVAPGAIDWMFDGMVRKAQRQHQKAGPPEMTMEATGTPSKMLLDEVLRRYDDCHDLFAAHVNPKIMRVLCLMGFDEPFVEAHGCYLQGREGKRFLDFHSGEGATSLGYNHPDVTQFLTAIMDRGLPNMIQLNCNVLAGMLAERLLAKAPKYLSKVYFTSSGGETVDSALKFARCATGRNRILYCRQSFHGLTLGALSICGDEEFKEGFGTPLPHTTQIEFNDLAQLKAELKKGDVAAFITEPLQGREVRVAEQDFLAKAGLLCREHGALFILDEIQTGLGRTGTFFALEQFDAQPDLLLVAKALSGGLVPVGAVLMRERIFASVYSSLERCYVHHSTYGYNTLAMAAGLATLDVIERQGLVANAKAMGAKIRAGLEGLKSRHSMLADIRGQGLMFAIELGKCKGFFNKIKWGVIEKVSRGLMPQMVVIPLFKDHGILSMVSGFNNVIKFIPPLIIGDAEVDYFLKSLDQVLTECETTSRPQELLFDLARRTVSL